jgi:hypothetical protein
MPNVAWSAKNSERLIIDPEKIRWLTRLVNQGEGLQLEFKAKTTYPDKIVKEMVAFANTKGGTLLIGVNDDGHISGVKYPEEDSLLILKALAKYCRPRIKTKYEYIRISDKKWVVVFEIWESNRKPVKFQETKRKRITFIRHEDKSLQASREGEGILKLRFGKNPIAFQYGEIENKLLKTLAVKQQATLEELQKFTGINDAMLSSKLIQLAAARVIGWSPRESHDLFLSGGSKDQSKK